MEAKHGAKDADVPVELQQKTSCPGESTEFNLANRHDQLERGLKSRHIQFLALGGAIGTDLFIGSGSILAQAGPAALFMGYLSMILVIWVMMNILAEMVTYLPMRGISVPYFIARFVDKSLAFAAGWNYWYSYAILVGAEAVAASIIIEYWNPPAHVAVWIAVVLVVNLILNIVAVGYFGEAEFWFASIKVITILGLIILGIVIFFGGAPDQDGVLGFRYWKDPGSFVQFQAGGSLGRFLAYWYAFIKASHAFLFSPELASLEAVRLSVFDTNFSLQIAIAAGETVAPRRNIPKAARRFVWRLAIFYGISSLIIGIMVPSNNARLLGGSSDASASPFVIGIQMVGIPALNHIINAAILTSAWSAGNSFLYSGSRVLYSLSLEGQAPKCFSITNKNGVPWVAVLTTWGIGLLAFLNVSNSGAVVFNWFVSIAIVSGLLSWIVVCVTYLRFRRAMEFNGLLQVLPHKTPLQPYATWATLVIITLLMLTNGFNVFINGNWDVRDFLASYVTLPIFLVLYLGHKAWSRSRFWIPTKDIDAETGRREMDELEAMDELPMAKNSLQKFWNWVA
ncbi:hypothetical protein ACJ41O_013745 [Fusarium nematophilum]